jgi:hypothetical protein
VQCVIRTNLHALTAADTTRQKIAFRQGARGAEQALVVFGSKRSGTPQQWNQRKTCRYARERATTAQVWNLYSVVTLV